MGMEGNAHAITIISASNVDHRSCVFLKIFSIVGLFAPCSIITIVRHRKSGLGTFPPYTRGEKTLKTNYLNIVFRRV